LLLIKRSHREIEREGKHGIPSCPRAEAEADVPAIGGVVRGWEWFGRRRTGPGGRRCGRVRELEVEAEAQKTSGGDFLPLTAHD
jgi:hypothetical protein